MKPKTLIVFVTVLCAGCFITLGDFDAAGIRRLAVGATPRRLVDSLFGNPASIDTSANSIVYRYAYSAQDPRPSTPRIDRKLLFLEFVRDTLHGYLYSSSVGTQTTDFPEHLRDSVIGGRTTELDVWRLLGEPSGKTLLPTSLLSGREYSSPQDAVPAGSREAWTYSYSFTQRRGSGLGYTDISKQLVVYIDSAGTVTGTAFHATGLDIAGSEGPWCCPSTITYRLEKTSCVTIEVYDITGFLLNVLKNDDEETAGIYTMTPQLEDMPPGVYYVRIEVDGTATVRKLMLMK